MCWIDKEGDKDLTDSRLGRILETKRLNLVLVDVGERNTTVLDGFNTSEVLKTPVTTEKNRWRQALVSSWIITK